MIRVNDRQVDFGHYPNGELKLIAPVAFNTLMGLPQTNVDFAYESDVDLIKLMFVKRHIDRLVCKKRDRIICNLRIHYMPYSRMDRVKNIPADLFTLKYVCEFINSLDFNEVLVLEPHSDLTCGLLNNAKAIPVVQFLLTAAMIDIGFKNETDYIIFPDAGAQKRYASLMKYKHLVATKERNWETGAIGETRIVANLGEYFQESHKALIVDDLCSRGGTFIGIIEALDKIGYGQTTETHLLVAHLENNVHTGDLLNHITSIHATDSIYNDQPYVVGEDEYYHPLAKEKVHIHKIDDLQYKGLYQYV